MENQRDVVRAIVAETKAHFIDLVPTFQAAAAEGQMLYFAYDTHWNQIGQSLAAHTIAEILRDEPDCF